MTNGKSTNKIPKNEKIMEKVTCILQKRGEKALEMAKNMILSEKLECKKVNEAFEYYVKNWSDYIHPALVSIACEAVNGNPDDSVPMQAVMLLFTAAFDIHDDIIDGSKTKYGRPTLLARFGKDIALLVGDAFLIKALTLLHKLREQFSAQVNAIWKIINNYFFELGDAEALESSSKGDVDISPERCFHILEKKASSFEVHMRIGAIVGNGEQSEIDLLGNYGRILGILTSVREDFIDIFEPNELQNRMKNELLPIPILHAFKNLQAKKNIMKILSKLKISNKDAEKVIDIVFEESNVKTFKKEINHLAEKALKNTSRLQNQNVKSQMQMLVIGVLEDL
jgi:geranylgeranyl diphosphate synthase type I